MNNRLLAVFDSDKEFVSEFINYLNREYCNEYDIYAFTTFNAVQEFTQNTHIDIMLVSNESFEKKLSDCDIGQIIILTEKKAERFKEYKSVHKYQKAGNVMREVLECVEVQKVKKSQEEICQSQARIIGVYSPIKRCMKTMFALTLSDILAKDNEVLYINFEEYSGLRTLMGEEFIADLSDLMYFYILSPQKMMEKYSVIKKRFGKVNIIPPMIFSDNIKNTEPVLWREMIRYLSENANENIIILDLSNMVSDVFELLQICDEIFVPTKNDFISDSKLEEFFRVIKDKERQNIEDRIHIVKVGEHEYFEKCSSIENVVKGEFRHFVQGHLGKMEDDNFE